MNSYSQMFQNDLLKAVEQVDLSYFPHGERTYAYELYFHLKTNFGNQYHSKLMLTAEIIKSEQRARELYNIPNEEVHFGNKTYTQPDFTLHEPHSISSQVCVVEIKVKADKKGILEDLIKLTAFKKEYRFQSAVFLLVVEDIATVKFTEIDLNGVCKDIIIITKDNYSSAEMWRLGDRY